MCLYLENIRRSHYSSPCCQKLWKIADQHKPVKALNELFIIIRFSQEHKGKQTVLLLLLLHNQMVPSTCLLFSVSALKQTN